MKRLFVLLLALMLLLSGVAAQAATWPEGRSPSQPYSNVPAVDLSATIGYMMLYPCQRIKLTAEYFCDVLEIYLPRQDVAINEGTLRLFKGTPDGASEVVYTAQFGVDKNVQVRPLDESELTGLMWGGGVCVEVRLPKSMELNQNYYVLMDQGCFGGLDGLLPSPVINNPAAWDPIVKGDFGVSSLYYYTPAAEPLHRGAQDVKSEPSATPVPTPEPEPIEPKFNPVAGDELTFELVMGGNAATAVVYSTNGSVSFDTIEYTASCTVTGKILNKDVSWGIVFLDDNGEIIKELDMFA